MALKMGEHPQVVRRQFWQMEDQHGRTWGGEFDMRVQPNPGCVSAGLYPDHWRAPLMPPPQYQRIEWQAHRKGGPRMVIDYQRWIDEQARAVENWENGLHKLGHVRQGDAYNPERPSPALLAEMGSKPRPVEPIRAAQAGDPWVLGLKQPNGAAYPMPDWAIPYFGARVKDPLAFMRGKAEGKAVTAASPPASRQRLSNWQQFVKDHSDQKIGLKELSRRYRKQKTA